MDCAVLGCAGPTAKGTNICDRHVRDLAAPPMKVTCECVAPDVEHLRVFGANAAQCRRCGSPLEGTLSGN